MHLPRSAVAIMDFFLFIGYVKTFILACLVHKLDFSRNKNIPIENIMRALTTNNDITPKDVKQYTVFPRLSAHPRISPPPPPPPPPPPLE